MNKCRLCGSTNIKSYQHPKYDMLFHECLNCEVIYKDETCILSEIDEKKVYDLHQNTIENEGYVNFLTNFIESAVIPFIKKGKALDFGSGPGPVLSELLKTRYQFDVETYDYYYDKNIEVLNKSYDLITSTEVLEHLKDPLSTLKMFYKMLNDEGIVSIMTLFRPISKNDFFEWFYIRDRSHITFFTPKTFSILASLLDFEVIDTNHYRYITLKKLLR